MIAQYETVCPICHEDIQQGDFLDLDEDTERWAHNDCVSIRATREAAGVVCTECFIIKPCECDA